MAFSRISITLPRALLVEADRRAKALGRSRSWVLAEALRAYLAGSAAPRVSESPVPDYGAQEVAAARLRHLKYDLALPPAERPRRVSELAALAHPGRREGRRHQIIGFDSYEDFCAWKKARRAGA